MKHAAIVVLRIALVLAGLPILLAAFVARIVVAFAIVGWRLAEEVFDWILA